MDNLKKLFESIRNRKSRSSVITADRYFHDLESCVGGLCPSASADEWTRAKSQAESKLTYSGSGMKVVPKSLKASSAEAGILQFDAIITTPNRDRDGDVLDTKGAILDMDMPLLWQHIPMSPIGKMIALVEHSEEKCVGRFVVANTSLGRDAAELLKCGALRISHGFNPIEYDVMDDEEGWHFKKFEIYETSVVSIPANPEAVILDIAGKSFETDWAKGFVKSLVKKSGGTLSSVSVPASLESGKTQAKRACQCQANKRWTDVSVSKVAGGLISTKDFDVERQHVEAARLEYDWVSRFCSCEVKQLVNQGTSCSRIKMGSFLTGLRLSLDKQSVQVDARRLTRTGTETPLEYEQVQLNSEKSDNFLVDGISFRKTADGVCFAVKFERTWRGVDVQVYSARKDFESVSGILGEAWEWTSKNNFLKGEAFSLSGEFLPKSNESWGDLFLDSKNEDAIQRTVKNLNEKGQQCPNRGIVMMGPPGTGKTLSGRLIRNNCDASFIWISGKDAYYYGGVNAVLQAFELAKELAPSVVFMEDIDASLTSSYATDVLKTEMDGIGQSTGVVTVLTTNHPKMFPEALLDRPGRFHDVLKFDLPTAETRKAMIEKWLPDLDKAVVGTTVKETEGYSGAHVYELCQYSKNLMEQEEAPIEDAVKLALTKIAEQRELINEELMQGRNMASRRRTFEKPVITKDREIEIKTFTQEPIAGQESRTISDLDELIDEASADEITKAIELLKAELAERADLEFNKYLEPIIGL